MNFCRHCVYHQIEKTGYRWCSLKGDDRYQRDNKAVGAYDCACFSFKEKIYKTEK